MLESQLEFGVTASAELSTACCYRKMSIFSCTEMIGLSKWCPLPARGMVKDSIFTYAFDSVKIIRKCSYACLMDVVEEIGPFFVFHLTHGKSYAVFRKDLFVI